MKKILGYTVLTMLLALGGYIAYLAFSVTDPYVVKVIRAQPAASDKSNGFSIDKEHHTLSVVSDKDVVAVADPGVSFSYVVLWLIEKPRKDNSTEPKEFTFELSEYARADKIFRSDSTTPQKVLKTATGGWN